MKKWHTEFSEPQLAFMRMKAAYCLFVGGYRSGKTFVNVYNCIRLLLWLPKGSVVYYYMPTFDMVTAVALPTFEKVMSMLGYGNRFRWNETKKTLFMPGGRKVKFRTMDNIASIAGYETVFSFADEAETVRPIDNQMAVWNAIIARNSLKLEINGEMIKPQTFVTTTPDCGFMGLTYQLWGAPQTFSADKRAEYADYQFVKSPTLANASNLTPGYVEQIRRSYPEKLAKALLDGDWVNLTSGLVYTEYDVEACRSRETVTEGDRTIYVGMDFNVGKMVAIVNVRRINPDKQARHPWAYHAVDEFVKVLDTPTMIHKLKEAYPNKRIVVYPDCAGVSRKSSDASVSDIALLERAGFSTLYHGSHPPVKDRVLAMNSSFKTGSQKVNDERCPVLVKSLCEQAYDKNGEPSKDNNIDHPLDAQGYLVEYTMPIRGGSNMTTYTVGI